MADCVIILAIACYLTLLLYQIILSERHLSIDNYNHNQDVRYMEWYRIDNDSKYLFSFLFGNVLALTYLWYGRYLNTNAKRKSIYVVARARRILQKRIYVSTIENLIVLSYIFYMQQKIILVLRQNSSYMNNY